MQSKTTWQHLDDSMVVEVSYVFGEVNPEPGYYSQEKITQTLREKTVSAVIYSCKNEYVFYFHIAIDFISII